MSIRDKRVYKLSVRGHRSVLLEASDRDELKKSLVAAGVENDKAKDWAEALWRDTGVRYQAGDMTIRHTGYLRYEAVPAAKPGRATETKPASLEPTTEGAVEALPVVAEEQPTGQDRPSTDSDLQPLMAFMNDQIG
ncbi:hypothetical protein Q0M94_10780 [Deinococcus radiomollis]|uniref:hypothetical protein n=1 Tax=Deinococcus radiomollis TaxID=468916 RepID=UPI0038927B7D